MSERFHDNFNCKKNKILPFFQTLIKDSVAGGILACKKILNDGRQ